MRPVLPRRASIAGLVASATICSVASAAPLQQRSRRASDSDVGGFTYVQIVPTGCWYVINETQSCCTVLNSMTFGTGNCIL